MWHLARHTLLVCASTRSAFCLAVLLSVREKQPVCAISVEKILAPVHEHFKSDAACKKAVADVKAAIKKASKKK